MVRLVRSYWEGPGTRVPPSSGGKAMLSNKWLVAAGLAVALPGCVETNGYPTTSYGGYPSGYGYSNGYYPQPPHHPQPPHYQPQLVTQTRYVPVPRAHAP